MSNKQQDITGQGLERLKAAVSDLVKQKPGGIKIAIWAGELDPDSMGSAIGIAALLSHVFQEGMIDSVDLLHSRVNFDEQNRTMKVQLSIPIMPVTDISNDSGWPARYNAFIFVDCVPREKWSKDLVPLMVIDHHKDTCPKAAVEDVRECGSSCALVCEYLSRAGYDFGHDDTSQRVSTALFFGILNDTHSLASDNTSDIDINAIACLAPHILKERLKTIMNFDYPDSFFDVRKSMELPENHLRSGKYFIGFAGFVTEQQQSILYMLADERVRDPAVEHSIICGIVGNNIRIHVRSKGSMEVDWFCKRIFGKNYGGGKTEAGRVEFPLENFSIHPDREGAFEVGKKFIWEILKDKLLQLITGE